MNEKTLDRLIKLTTYLIVIGVILSGFFYYKNRIAIKQKNPPIIDQQIEILEKKVAKTPGDFDLRILIAKRLIDRDREGEAIDHLDAAEKIKKDTSAVSYLTGFAYQKQDDIENAKTKYLRTIKLGNKEQFKNINTYIRDANFYLADIYYNEKDYKKALKYYKEASTIGTADSDTLYKIGKLYALDKDYKNAMVYYEKALAFVPNYAEVLTDYDKALKKSPSTEGYLGLAKSYKTLGQIELNGGKKDKGTKTLNKAKSLYTKALGKDSENKEAKEGLAEIDKLLSK